ncbi:MAG: CopG family transcriptional regulator [Actinomycetales bacterium]
MRTTLVLPDDLYREVKVTAIQRGETVTAFVVEALRAALARGPLSQEMPDLPLLPDAGGLVVGVDLDDTSALLENLDEADRALP